jgi:hypothetical protein
MYTVWHVDKYKITFKLVIDHWPRARYRVTARRLRNTALEYSVLAISSGVGKESSSEQKFSPVRGDVYSCLSVSCFVHKGRETGEEGRRERLTGRKFSPFYVQLQVKKGKGKVVPVLNESPRHEGVLGE